MKQNSFVIPTKHFAESMKFWLFEQNVLLGKQKKCRLHFFLMYTQKKILLNQ